MRKPFVLKDCEEALNCDVEINGKPCKFCAATIGNPHCVLRVEKATPQIAHTLGPILENMTSLFPNRTNVQFLEIIDRKNIKIEIWERGAGYTLASGSSSSAAAVARKLGLVDEKITVHMPGGEIFIEIAPDFSVIMSGSVVKVGVYDMSKDVLMQKLPEETNK